MPSVVRVTNLEMANHLWSESPTVALMSAAGLSTCRGRAGCWGSKMKASPGCGQVLTEQSLRLEQLAKQGQFLLLAEAAKAPVPETVAVSKPAVSLRAKPQSRSANRNLPVSC